jgi:hypothetical protein
MEEHGVAGQATNNNTIQRMRIACSVSNATNTQLKYVTLQHFDGNNGDVDAPHCYVRLTVPVLLFIVYVHSILFSSLFHPFLIFIILFLLYLPFIFLSYNVIFTLAFSTLIPSLSQSPFWTIFNVMVIYLIFDSPN